MSGKYKSSITHLFGERDCHFWEIGFKVTMKQKIIAAYLKGFFFVLEIFTFLYYANEESDDVINSAIKTMKY